MSLRNSLETRAHGTLGLRTNEAQSASGQIGEPVELFIGPGVLVRSQVCVVRECFISSNHSPLASAINMIVNLFVLSGCITAKKAARLLSEMNLESDA